MVPIITFVFFCQSIKLDPLYYVIVNAIYRIIFYIVQVTTNVIKLATSWLIVVPAIISSTCILVLIEKKISKEEFTKLSWKSIIIYKLYNDIDSVKCISTVEKENNTDPTSLPIPLGRSSCIVYFEVISCSVIYKLQC